MERVTNPVDGTAIAYRTFGDGPPLVLVHATALSQAMWRGVGYVRALQDRYRLVLIDIRGHGHSDKPHASDAYAMDLIVGDVTAVLDDLGIERTHVMGYSLGARVSLSFAVAHPARVDHLVLGGGSSRAQSGVLDRLFFPNCAEVLGRDGMPEFLRRWEAQRGAPLDDATTGAFSANDAQALAAYFRRSEIETGVDDSALQQISSPTLVYIGADDEIRLDENHHMAEQIPGARLAVLPALDHMGAIGAMRTVLDVVEPFLDGLT